MRMKRNFNSTSAASAGTQRPARRCRIYEMPVSYNGRDYKEGKKIGWKDGVQALYCIVRYAIAD